MSWTVWFDAYETAGQAQDTTCFQGLKWDDNYIITTMRAWIVIVNSPSFTNMVMKVYGNDESQAEFTPSNLIATSTNPFSISDVNIGGSFLGNGVFEVGFQFDGLHVRKDTTYNFVMNFDGYFPTATSYVGWKRAWPDPVAQTGFTPTGLNLNTAPFEVYGVGDKL